MDAIRKFVKGEEGQSMIEYALIGALVSIIAIVAIGAAGTAVNTIWGNIQAALE